MVEITVKPITKNKRYVELAGKSTEAKPVTGIVTGSLFHEVDTATVYGFVDGDSPEWVKQVEFGGGSDG